MEAIKNFWFKLPAKQKRQLVITLGAAVGVMILWQFLSVEHRERPDPVEPSSVRLTGEGTERFQMDVLVSRLERLQREQKEFKDEVREARRSDTTQRDIERLRQQHQQEVARLERQLEQQRQSLLEEQRRLTGQTLDETLRLMEQVSVPHDAQIAPGQVAASPAPHSHARPHTPTREDLWGDESRFQASGRQQNPEEDVPTARITVIETKQTDAASKDKGDDDGLQFLPAGTIISGTLITGLDAPTAQGTSHEPHPALFRVKEDAIMPNRYRGDIRECFIILSGFGDLSTERAYLRSETLSCINNNGEAMETSLASFAVGEDGSAGVRGRLVSKEGQLLAQSLKAGALSAFADVFRSTPVPTIQTSNSDSVPFQRMLSRDSLQSGAIQGTSDALDRIAQYYLDVADMIFPVIEVSAGREIDLVVNRGTQIRFTR